MPFSRPRAKQAVERASPSAELSEMIAVEMRPLS